MVRVLAAWIVSGIVSLGGGFALFMYAANLRGEEGLWLSLVGGAIMAAWPVAAVGALVIKAHSNAWGAVVFWAGNVCLLFSIYYRGDGFAEESMAVIVWLSFLAVLAVVKACKSDDQAVAPARDGANQKQQDSSDDGMAIGFDTVDSDNMTTMFDSGGNGKFFV
jgi:hypothetical protein